MSKNFIIPAMLSLGIAGMLSGCSTTPKMAEAPLVRGILEKQSADVDAVSGATNSSHVIVNAVQQALNKACGE